MRGFYDKEITNLLCWENQQNFKQWTQRKQVL